MSSWTRILHQLAVVSVAASGYAAGTLGAVSMREPVAILVVLSLVASVVAAWILGGLEP